MANILDKVKTVVLVMFENRSFDHMLGHLSYEGLKNDVDGLKEPLSQYQNLYKGDAYNPYPITGDTQLESDVPHEYNDVELQLAKSKVTGKLTMSGFVNAYAEATEWIPNSQSLPMGFFRSGEVPITSFMARTFCTCNRFFTSIPTSTQPNRTMAFCGESNIYSTKTRLNTVNNHLLDWLTNAGIRWRTYHDGLSFFALFPQLWKYVLGSKFRDFEFLAKDIQAEPASAAPQVIIVEPSYHDAPHIGSDRPNDNHAPLAIGWGEEFLRRTYESITANQKKWESTVMIVYYDEHGGFYDHVPPPFFKTSIGGKEPFTFDSLGPRIPAIIASPLVKPGSVSNSLFDHTSVLQFLAEKFTPGKPYSSSVNNRKAQGIESISAALSDIAPWVAPPPPSVPINVKTALGATIETGPTNDLGSAFAEAATEMMNTEPTATNKKYPELQLWKKAVENARGTGT